MFLTDAHPTNSTVLGFLDHRLCWDWFCFPTWLPPQTSTSNCRSPTELYCRYIHVLSTDATQVQLYWQLALTPVLTTKYFEYQSHDDATGRWLWSEQCEGVICEGNPQRLLDGHLVVSQILRCYVTTWIYRNDIFIFKKEWFLFLSRPALFEYWGSFLTWVLSWIEPRNEEHVRFFVS